MVQKAGMAVAVVALSILTGCTAAPDTPDLAETGFEDLSSGTTVTYEAAADGPTPTRLELEVHGTATRVDRGLEAHEALVYNLTLDPANGDMETYWEAVALDTGHLLQRIDFCPEESPQCPVSLGDVLFPTSPTPGVMGTGPLLANHETTESPSEGTVTAPGEGNRTSADLARMAEATENRTCRTLPVAGPTGGVLAPKALIPEGSMAVCEGLPVPAWFDTRAGRTFALTEGPNVTGDVPAPAQGSKDAPTVDPPARNAWTSPLMAAAEPHPGTFPLEEAHEAALEESEGYASFHEDHEDALVVASRYFEKGRSQSGPIAASESFEHELVAATPDGEGYRVLLEKEVTRYGPQDPGSSDPVPLAQQQEEEIQVLEEEPVRWDQAPSGESAAPRQVHTWAAVNVSERLADRPWDGTGSLRVSSSSRAGMAHLGWDGGPIDRVDGYAVTVFLTGPELSGPRTVLLPVQFDGPTGDLRWATVELDRLPLGLQ